MKKLQFLFLLFTSSIVQGQDTLPRFSAVQSGNSILISWKNNISKNIEHISIQRSYDSLKHYSTIGNVLNPLAPENGYTDYNPPFVRMYYRVFIAFSDGTYIISTPVKPIQLPPPTQPEPESTVFDPEVPGETPLSDSTNTTKPEETEVPDIYRPTKREPWRVDPLEPGKPITTPGLKEKEPEVITYPSKRIFTTGNEQVVLILPDAIIKQYSARFYNADGRMIFELKHLKENYLILEKVYFGKSGWYTFEIYDRGKLIEKNKLFVPQDKKKQSILKSRP
ncbi:MAG TPA: hypothetical protein PKY29_06295 [Ferruginibacter sp.]|nr:hypothetical protein [Ferruginibacter sp.]HRO18185.1 hypothetical protein [Ferruginibacter sp.]HRQ20907.1 hypothetical protein [Ferruginibacter sp.]